MAELTDQVRKAMRDDWREHVDRQAVEARSSCIKWLRTWHVSSRGFSGALVFALRMEPLLRSMVRPRHDGFAFTLGISMPKFSRNRNTTLH